MYCPNCGVEIHQEGSFCAKCKKNVDYLTHKKPETPITIAEVAPLSTDVVSPTPIAEIKAATPAELITSSTATSAMPTPQPIGYYCNVCGCFVYPEDNFCYECGKKTQRSYYQPLTTNHRLQYFAIAAGSLVILSIAAYFFL